MVEQPQNESDNPNKAWLNRIDAAIRAIEDRIPLWQTNTDKRKAGKGDSGTEQVQINKDWPLVKAKIAQLYSQTPEVRLSAKMPELAQMVPQFAKTLNEAIAESNVGATVEECLADAVNASGITGAHVSCEKLTAWKQVPRFGDPMIQMMSGNEMLDVEEATDIAYPAPRLSPADLLIDTTFTGSDYDQSRWIGRRGRMTWQQGVRAFKLTEDQKEKVVSSDHRQRMNNTLNTDGSKFRDQEVVNFSEVYYWRHYFHPEETSFKAIQHIVFVDGIEEPVINEEYAGQKRMPDGSIIGMTKFPIRILTLTYVSDESLPPSDSTIARAQVDELEQLRQLEIDQRKHSIPVRWFNPAMVGPNARAILDKGTPQGFIPINGMGERAIGEVSRASFPSENLAFEDRAERSLGEIYQIGNNQAGNDMSGDKSATEARVIQQNFQTRVGQERDKVAKFFVGIAECLANLISLHGNSGLPPEIAGQVTYSVKTDASVRLSADEEIRRLEHLIDRSAQSPFIDPRPLMAKWFELHGQDPANLIIEPQPKPPEPVSLSLKGEDLLMPMALAHLYRTKQAPSPEDLAMAVDALQALAMAEVTGMRMNPPAQEPDGRPPRESDSVGIANPDWQMAPRQDKRDEDGGA